MATDPSAGVPGSDSFLLNIQGLSALVVVLLCVTGVDAPVPAKLQHTFPASLGCWAQRSLGTVARISTVNRGTVNLPVFNYDQ